jgi:hypothetical protein
MRDWLVVLSVAFLVGACGAGGSAEVDIATTTAIPDGNADKPVSNDDRPEPGSQQASHSPEPLSEPILIPVPAPVPEPSKPARPGLPTPPPPRPTPQDPEPISDDAIRDAIADLADRLDVNPNVIDVLDARQVTWRDGSVGCPVPGLAYPQAEVRGYLVILRAGDTSYRYHAADAAASFLCDNPQGPLEGSA